MSKQPTSQLEVFFPSLSLTTTTTTMVKRRANLFGIDFSPSAGRQKNNDDDDDEKKLTLHFLAYFHAITK